MPICFTNLRWAIRKLEGSSARRENGCRSSNLKLGNNFSCRSITYLSCRKTGDIYCRPNTATRYGTSHTAKRPFARSNGLVEGSYAAEKSLPIGNPCDAELSNLMRCMRDNDYDNTPCLGTIRYNIGVKFLSDVQKAYLTCCQTALSDYNAKKERFLNGERTDGLYSQKVINEMFEDVNQKLDMNQWRFICNSVSSFRDYFEIKSSSDVWLRRSHSR